MPAAARVQLLDQHITCDLVDFSVIGSERTHGVGGKVPTDVLS